MRTLQLLGFILALAGLILGYLLLAPVEGDTSAASASATGLGLMFVALPLLGMSALFLVPSSLALFKGEVRQRTYFAGRFWLALWKLNLVICACYLSVVLYLAVHFAVHPFNQWLGGGIVSTVPVFL